MSARTVAVGQGRAYPLLEAARAKYWSEVAPDWIHNSDTENNEGVERLLKAERPRAAFSCIRFEPGKLDAQVLFRLLSAMAHGGNDQPGHYMIEHYNVEAAFKHLNSSPALTLDQKASLEFAYIDVLARPWDNGTGGRRDGPRRSWAHRYPARYPVSKFASPINISPTPVWSRLGERD